MPGPLVPTVSTADWTIVTLYIAAMIGFSLYLGRGQADQTDYYVGGRNLPWWAVGISAMATQTSAFCLLLGALWFLNHFAHNLLPTMT